MCNSCPGKVLHFRHYSTLQRQMTKQMGFQGALKTYPKTYVGGYLWVGEGNAFAYPTKFFEQALKILLPPLAGAIQAECF
ncbi:MAG: hypothetical protein KatS3mg049_2053 [Caldilinea sp.]|jgi:hypothetical protein|nr:MAG: hypothetical protein KatS3mg049_2053 [Caldilinea sp.]